MCGERSSFSISSSEIFSFDRSDFFEFRPTHPTLFCFCYYCVIIIFPIFEQSLAILMGLKVVHVGGETTGTFGWGDLDPVGQVTVGEQHRYPLTP